MRVFYEVYGDAPTTFLLFPTSPISHSRLWKAQIPYLSRHFRVVTFDPRGNGRSDRPSDAAAYSLVGVRRPTAGPCWRQAATDARSLGGALRRRRLGADARRDRSGSASLGVAAIAPFVPRLTPSHPNYRQFPSDVPLDTDEGWAKCNLHYWRRDYRGFLEFFFAQQIPEPHSTKQIEDCVRWGLEGGAESLILADEEAPHALGERGGRAARSASVCAAPCS